MTPMMQQYLDIKENYKEYILMYRIGDFYEMFYDDAKAASQALDLVLTGRDNGDEERAPMCGVPFHAVDNYIGRLVSKGYKVAICEQMEDPALAKGLVKREVIKMITPGTITESSFLDEKKNNYICSICLDGDNVGVAFADISTGDVSATEFSGDTKLEKLMAELGTHSPSEAVINCSLGELGVVGNFLKTRIQCLVNENEDIRFDGRKAYDEAQNRLTSSPIEFSDSENVSLRAFGAIISYAEETQKNELSNISAVNYYKNGEYLEIDVNSRRNLELCETMRRAERRGTLLWVLDKTKTAAGARMLRKFIDFPLRNPVKINKRQEAVAELYDNVVIRSEIFESMTGILDLERLITKIAYGSANPKDMRAIWQTCNRVPQIKALISNCHSEELKSIYDNMDSLEDICQLIDASIVEDPPLSIREGGFIKGGFSPDIDHFRSILFNSKEWLSKMEEDERNNTGIRTLKVGYNKVFGYYIEVSKSFVDQVPERFIRKQTLTNGERYITQELKELETQLLGANDKLTALEYQAFVDLRLKIAENIHRIQSTASMLAKLDVFCSLAEAASQNNYTRPEVTYGDTISIVDGRHPVVEQFSKDSFFVPNDTELNGKNSRFMLITGPNMAGKSTYMRQVALICVMAQIGSFVPAREARISTIDKIFTRVGASDDLAMGQSTFMLEMSEVAYILENATKQSLIIYDEIGRGTSTYDGMSIAKAVAEYTAGKKIGAKTLFATHYHELTSLENEIEGVVNYNIAAKKKGDTITFLRKIVRGAADDSYGIEVAKLAGVPNEVTKRAKDILNYLIENGAAPTVTAKVKTKNDDQITFENFEEAEVCQKLRDCDINTLTPLEALNLIFELKKILH
ncbi:MAG: DNA mismatch repair protein MutS [Clostridia bacterium]|nr:DNA mismatch repair protein MutS [Clostridia bacterium]